MYKKNRQSELETQPHRQCVQMLQYTTLFEKLSAGDLIVQETKYHVQCLAYLYRQASKVSSEDET